MPPLGDLATVCNNIISRNSLTILIHSNSKCPLSSNIGINRLLFSLLVPIGMAIPYQQSLDRLLVSQDIRKHVEVLLHLMDTSPTVPQNEDEAVLFRLFQKDFVLTDPRVL